MKGGTLRLGQCGLCLEYKELRNSHLMPKALYKKLKGAFDGDDLVLNQSHDKSSIYSDFQVTSHFLCSECELRFSRLGENAVVSECYTGTDKFPLLERLKSAKQFASTSKRRESWFNPIQNDFPNTDCYLYFAASIIWRASAWPMAKNSNQKSLGPRYQEEFRSYLLGERGFPSNAYLAVYVDIDEDIIPKVSFPTSSKKLGYHHHIFYIPGVKFSLIVGGNVGEVRKLSSAQATKAFFISYSFKKHPDYQFMVRELLQEYKPKGRLARERHV
ncbi:hypothetical protein R3X26_13915 [Vibrio sp. TH_r3]|uniref:hypothetical protein n=1 Tax=Vibrio sp. TH_r3 TaxID=3082084 RepID=UPI002954AC43|nr:hypothetical protein [Vibrio sp. TH_r3]MDV7105503.1 hypothetical protein [Vibrio sp. TH_r3]